MFFVAHEGWAHNVKVFAYLQGETIVVQGYFGGKAKAVDCGVQLIDAEGNTVVEGKTDSTGVCRFDLRDLGPVKGDVKIVLHAGMGHQAAYILAAAELSAAAKTASTTVLESKDEERLQPETVDSASPANPKRGGAYDAAYNAELVRKAVEEAVDAKMESVFKMLESHQKLLMDRNNKGPSIAEIVGGIGWIFGIVGIAAYCMSRRGARNGHVDAPNQ